MLANTYITLLAGVLALNFPVRATSACGTAASRYLSACRCRPTCSATPTPTPTPCPAYGGLLPNGDFECGVSPWTVKVPDADASAAITALSSNSGQRSFEARLLKDRPRQDPVLSVSAGSGVFSVQPNVPGKLTFALWFDNMDAGFVGVKFNWAPIRTVDARDGAGWVDIVDVEYHGNSLCYYWSPFVR
ncbi:hypothetical protein LX32DRAFT_655982 [Colletotrichum zoysiae]|uniref:Uncharacterized protein n=1 Tax=Colletotrichum zoysiae TaxID=1216348 RepID=A0AAD9HB98_9PEZI|nr:hypothetical protein LX32DRAFT_655982 [Colletotrichum zoysiae]